MRKRKLEKLENRITKLECATMYLTGQCDALKRNFEKIDLNQEGIQVDFSKELILLPADTPYQTKEEVEKEIMRKAEYRGFSAFPSYPSYWGFFYHWKVFAGGKELV